MHFTTGRQRPSLQPGIAWLEDDNWDDYGFKTLFSLYCHNGDRTVNVGGLKIGSFNMRHGRTQLPQHFEALAPSFFSLGVDESFYATLRDEFDDETRKAILVALRDVAYDPELFEQALGETVMEDSLLRGTDAETVRTQYHRIAKGGPTLSRFDIRYEQVARSESAPPLILDLTADPDRNPPTNIHAVIGSNGVGKTRLLHDIAQTTLTPRNMRRQSTLVDKLDLRPHPFANVVYVSFSAFDSHGPHKVGAWGPRANIRVDYQYVGLKTDDGAGLKDYATLGAEFAECVERCVEDQSAKARRWAHVLTQLEGTDPLFHDLQITELARPHDRPDPQRVFAGLSSGHKIVLLTLAKLVEYTTERTLVLIDEPEGHLHPPLLSTLVRTLSELLRDRNGLAVIATHSPVVLQETPREAVWALRRAGDDLRVDHPEIETFGENVGVITREIFGLEVRGTGFNRLIQSLAEKGMSFEDIIEEFDDQLGAEGRALARSATRRREGRR
ncbi:ATP-binding protein [Streptomyces sp. OUCMDZ-4982]|uniref:ATP-binding protein n=1 Tax=Streptomyces sp. OUCMDZ-4982 TaxID=2973090 RepID=UPI00215C67D3|nr:ATP-binding protein [Streptomyces sp. OUCMDZ-4982]MCR8945173.1 ATP-binding protein [Streptomyces sp. OUCMDZ-4982]